MCRTLFVLFVLLNGCVREPVRTVTMTDDLGRAVQLEGVPDRLVSLAPSVTELIYAAGGQSKLVGVTTADDYPPDVHHLTRISALPVDFEAILALDPDLVLASEQVNGPNDAATLAAVHVPTYFVSVANLDDVFRAIRTLGTLLDTEAVAHGNVDSLQRMRDRLRLRTQEIEHRPSTLFLISDVTLYSFGHGSYMHELINIAGGRSITADLTTRAPVLTDEFVLAQQPDIIVGPFGADFKPEHLLLHHPTWDVLGAVESGRVYALEASYFLRPGPRLVEGAWQLARVLHPNLEP
ncbi:MAG: helical backbone metal receptor [Bacteroidota bacterium]|nr:helical backbone metal receptor [Bacteroidota bacterium]